MQTATKVVDRSAYEAELEGWKAFSRERGANKFAIVRDLKDGIFRCFPLFNGETEESLRHDFDDERYFKLCEVFEMGEQSSTS